ncbi:MAG: Asp/Glu racemase [bacterium]
MAGANGDGIYCVGLLVPSSNTTMEGDLHRNLPEEVEIVTSRMFLEKTTRDDEIHMIEESAPEALRMVKTARPRVTVFGCTSGGSLFGREYDRSIMRKIEEETGTEAISILSSLSEEFEALGAKKLLVFTPYIDELNRTIKSSLEEDGLEVLAIEGMKIVENVLIGAVRPGEILAFAREKAAPSLLEEADCVFFSCTNLPAVRALPLLRAHFGGKPVMTSNLAAINAVRRRYEKAHATAG